MVPTVLSGKEEAIAWVPFGPDSKPMPGADPVIKNLLGRVPPLKALMNVPIV
jgi:hypothetical protein